MARILQTGFELPTTLGSSTYTNWPNVGRPGYAATSANGVTNLALPVSAYTLRSGWRQDSCPTLFQYDTVAHKSVTGLGGRSIFQFKESGYGLAFASQAPLQEGYFSFAIKPQTHTTTASNANNHTTFNVDLLTASGSRISGGGFSHNGGYIYATSGTYNFYTPNTLASPEPVGVLLDTSIWHWVTIGWTSTGTKIWINTAGSSQILSYTGLIPPIKTIRVGSNTNCSHFSIDDVVWHTPSISFINCSDASNLPTGVITGSSSNATASIDYVGVSDSTYGIANSGKMLVYGVTGAFEQGEIISNSDNSWTAEVKLAGGGDGGLDINSGKPGETFMMSLSLAGDKENGIELTGSDGNQIDNYALLNESLYNDNTYVQAAGLDTGMDMYTLNDISGDIQGITGISILTRTKKAGAISKLIPAIEIGNDLQYSNDPWDISGLWNWSQRNQVIDVNQVTNEFFTKAELNSANIGFRFK